MIDSLMQSYPESDRLHWNRDNDNFDVLRKADIMISDFSGVMFDFCLVFDKPLIYTDAEYDDAPYDACWLDEEPWTFRVLPKLGSKLTDENMKDIGALIENCLTDKSFEQGRAEARAEAWAHIGESAPLVADYLIKKHEEINSNIIS